MAIVKNLISIGDANITNNLQVGNSACIGLNNETYGISLANGNRAKTNGTGALASGNGVDISSYVVANSGGALAHGYVNASSYILSDNYGACAGGYADTSSHIYANSTGALAHGYAYKNSYIEADDNGTHAEGCANTSSYIEATSSGAHAEGYAYNNSYISSNDLGAFAGGSANSSSYIYANCPGALAYGYANASSYIEAASSGAHAEGCANTSSYIYANSTGALAHGYANTSSYIEASGDGAQAEGYADTSSHIEANSEGAFAGGYAYNNSYILANDQGAFAGGYTEDSSSIIANRKGSMAFGCGMVTADASGAIALGLGTWADLPGMCAVGSYNASTGNANTLFAVGAGSWHGGRNTVFRVTAPNGFGANVNCSINVKGAMTITDKVFATNGFFQTSDINKKNIISDIDLNKAYDLIDKCQTIIYTLKDDKSNREQIGMIALEVQEFFPEIVENYEDGALTIDYSKLTVIILRVLKDLIKKVDELIKSK